MIQEGEGGAVADHEFAPDGVFKEAVVILGQGNKIKRLLAIDGKTQRGNGSKNQKANHIVSGNHTIEKQASYNLNIMRKLALNILKVIETGKKGLSLKKKRYAIGTNPEKHLELIMNL